MSKRRFLLLALAVVLLTAGGISAWFAWPRKTVLTVEVTGTRGLAIQGTCEVDGSPRDLTGSVPTQFVLEGYRVTYSLVAPKDSGQFRVRDVIRDRAFGAAGSGNPPRNGVRGWVKSGWWGTEPAHWIEAFARDGQPGWLKPPP
jgi:hypothetical protein